jgi:MFS family permease
MYTVTYDQLTEEFNCSRIVATLGLSFFIWGLGLGPLVLGPLSEFYGRRNIYITSFIFFLIWLVPCAVAKNIQTMIVSRFFNGLAGSAFLSVAGGTVGDLFDRHELSAPMMLYTASPFVGPELGPLYVLDALLRTQALILPGLAGSLTSIQLGVGRSMCF